MTLPSTSIVTYLGYGVAASLPTPTLTTGASAAYYETDTTITMIWNGSAYVPVTGGQMTQTVSGATATITPTGGMDSIVVTLQANTTLTMANGLYHGQLFRLELLQDGTGSRTVAFSSSVEFGTTTGLTSFTATTAANKRDLIDLVWNSTSSKWMFYKVAQGFA